MIRNATGLDVQAMQRDWLNWASVSNVARLMILEKFGGVYLDCDMECLKTMDEKLLAGTAGGAYQDGNRICNAFLYAEPNHPWIQTQLRLSPRYKGYGAEWGVIAATETQDCDVTIVPKHLVFPWHYEDPPEKRVAHPDSYLTHHWAKDWK
jgi:mannosyltransferase OCH1-like enzyme